MYKSMMALIAGFGLLGLVAAAPLAHADVIVTGTLHFTVTSGSPAPTGSFVWNATTGTWNSFTVDWDGVVFNFAIPIRYNPYEAEPDGLWCGAGPRNNTLECADPRSFNLYYAQFYAPESWFTDQFAGAYGTYAVTTTTTTTTTAVPEPGPLGMMFAGLGVLGLFLTRRRVRRL